MKVFFDTTVYVAEALLGQTAEQLVEATKHARWRIYVSEYVLEELERVLTEKLGFSKRLANLSRRRIIQRSSVVQPGASPHVVPKDLSDNPILRAAMAASVDYLVTNDKDLLELNPFQGLRSVSMTEYYQILLAEGLLSQ